MKPAIDQMISWIEGEMAKYNTPAYQMDKGYRVLQQSWDEAKKIKERCDADVRNALCAGLADRCEPPETYNR